MRVLLFWSGGKDCALALSALKERQDCQIAGLLCTFTRPQERVSMHGVRRELIQQQAAALGVPLFESWIEQGAPNADYETAVRTTLVDVGEQIDAVAFGDLFLEDVRTYREGLIGPTGYECLFPLWGRPTDRVAREFIAAGYRACLCCVDSHAVSASLCGREFDHALLAEIPAGVDPCGENGEFHTFVYDAPGFAAPVPFQSGRQHCDGRFVYCDLIAQEFVPRKC